MTPLHVTRPPVAGSPGLSSLDSVLAVSLPPVAGSPGLSSLDSPPKGPASASDTTDTVSSLLLFVAITSGPLAEPLRTAARQTWLTLCASDSCDYKVEACHSTPPVRTRLKLTPPSLPPTVATEVLRGPYAREQHSQQRRLSVGGAAAARF